MTDQPSLIDEALSKIADPLNRDFALNACYAAVMEQILGIPSRNPAPTDQEIAIENKILSRIALSLRLKMQPPKTVPVPMPMSRTPAVRHIAPPQKPEPPAP